jgi:uncharacterized repeat protein (TIGR03803 family)
MKLNEKNILAGMRSIKPLTCGEPVVALLRSLLCAATLLLSVFDVSAAEVFTPLYEFSEDENGVNPLAGLIQGTDGNFYGTTQRGGDSGHGCVFRITSAGALTGLYSFTGNSDGSFPQASLVQGKDGLFYGTTYGNEYSTSGPYGSVFKISAAGKLTTLFTFTYRLQGLNPATGLVQGTDGSFYGTTYYGGTNFVGTIFKIDTNGVLTSLYSFTNGVDGEYPLGTLVQGTDGYFYGTAYAGGQYSLGTVFKITSTGAFVPLHSFAGYRQGHGYDGINPYAGLVLANNGYFYGTTGGSMIYAGTITFCGTIFQIGSDGAMSNLYTFSGNAAPQGSNPYAGLIQGSDGFLYGTTCYDTFGAVFQASTNGTVSVLHTFTNGIDGAYSQAGLVQGSDGYFYGTTPGGQTRSGANNLGGTIFKINKKLPPWITTQPISITANNGAAVTFSVAAEGSQPLGYQWQQNGMNLTDGGGILGSLTANLQFTVTGNEAGAYSVIVTNPYGSVMSTAATLTVLGAVPPSPVTLQAALFSNGLWSLNFPTTFAQRYTVQQKANLWTANWAFYTNLTGDGSPAQLVFPVTDTPSQFFRVLEP